MTSSSCLNPDFIKKLKEKNFLNESVQSFAKLWNKNVIRKQKNRCLERNTCKKSLFLKKYVPKNRFYKEICAKIKMWYKNKKLPFIKKSVQK